MARDPLAFFFAPEPSSSRDARDPAAAAAAVRMARPRRKGPPACGLPSGGGPGGAPAGAGPGGGAPGTAAAPGGGGGGAGGGLPQPPALWPPSTSVCPSPSSYKTKIRLTAPVSSSALAADTLTAVINNPNADAGIPGSAASLGFEMLEYDPLAEPQPPEFALDDAPMAHPLAAGVSAATARESSAAPDRKPPAAAGQRRSQSKDGFFGARRRAVRRSSDESASTTVSGRRQSTASSGFFSRMSPRQYVAFPTSPVSSRHPSPQRDDFFAGVELLSAPARHKCPGLLSARGCDQGRRASFSCVGSAASTSAALPGAKARDAGALASTVIPEESDAAIPSIVTLCEAPFYQNRTAEVFYDPTYISSTYVFPGVDGLDTPQYEQPRPWPSTPHGASRSSSRSASGDWTAFMPCGGKDCQTYDSTVPGTTVAQSSQAPSFLAAYHTSPSTGSSASSGVCLSNLEDAPNQGKRAAEHGRCSEDLVRNSHMNAHDEMTKEKQKKKKWSIFGKRKRKSRETLEVLDSAPVAACSATLTRRSSLDSATEDNANAGRNLAMWFNELEGARPRTQPSSRCATPLASPRRESNASASSYSFHAASDHFRESRAGSVDSSASGLAVLAMAEAVPPSASSGCSVSVLPPTKRPLLPHGAPAIVSPRLATAEAWLPPESWWVRTPTDDAEHESGRNSDDIEEATWDASSDRNTYVLRIFRPDDSFSTISCQVNTKAAEICAVLAKKFFLRDVSLYQLSVRKNGLDRVLAANEKPVQLMRRWLEQLGHRQRDGLEDLGREDHSYFFRFTFGESMVPNLPLLEANVTSHGRFRHVDFQARNLQTIPIVLFRNASQIDSLDVSENLLIDIPLDFIQLCTSLRELRISGCNLEKVPSSILHAANLRHLDLSHNKLRDLNHAHLENLSVLQSLLVDHNELESLPDGWRLFSSLTSLSASNNAFAAFPEVICQVSTLQELNLSFNKISSIPAAIGALLDLRRLLLIANHISGPLPAELASLKHLEELDFRTNAVTDIGVIADIPSLELLFADRNSIAVFAPVVLASVAQLSLSKNVFTNFSPLGMAPLMTYLNLSASKLADFCGSVPCQLPALEELVLDDNHLASLPDSISLLSNLRTLSVVNNHLGSLPKNIHKAQSLEFLDLHNNNIKALPAELWWCKSLVTVNVSSNLLECFPLPPVGEPDEDDAAAAQPDVLSAASTTPQPEIVDRRSIPIVARAIDASHKPSSSFSSSLSTSSPIAAIRRPLSLSLQNLYLGDNSLADDIFVPLTQLPELRVLNLCHNDIFEIPSGALFNQTALVELHLSGNHLSSLPGEEIERLRSLKSLYVAGNRLQTLPAELGKLHKLTVLDVGNNSLKYNVANWPYDWNWNWNPELRYLNFSGNKRLEIKQPQNENLAALFSRSGSPPAVNGVPGAALSRGSPAPHASKHSRAGSVVTLKPQHTLERNLTDFSAMANLRVLGLIDVTIMEAIPEETVSRRVRTAASDINGIIGYGMSGKLGENEVVRIWDRVTSKLLGRNDEALVSLFACCSPFDVCGCRTTRFLNDSFGFHFISELKRIDERNLPSDDPHRPFRDSLRRSYLSVNKELGSTLMHDTKSGASGAVIYLKDKKMFVSNVGDVEVVISKSGGAAQLLSRKHVPWDAKEMERVREAGGWVSEEGLVNGEACVSRAFGYFHLLPAVRPEPHIQCVQLSDQDEFVIVANRGLWDHISYQTAVDIARTEREDPMAAAEKLRDFAVTYGAKDGIVVMVFTVGDLFHGRKGARAGRRSGKGGDCQGDGAVASKNRREKRGAPGDSTLARLEKEVEPPTGKVALVFTDIKSSTFLWENYPIAMRSAIKIHNSVMRRLLRSIGGYEVKTEGDAFMVCFPSVVLAVLWCFSVQLRMLEADWPQEILASDVGCDVFGESLTPELLFRGLSVRMGIHWGYPVCEVDPVTRRMDYFGPMVNRAARICNVADGGQICVSSDVVAELTSQKDLFAECTAEDEDRKLPRENHALRKMGITVVRLGERKLKGLENAEVLSLLYPKSLSGRIQYSKAARCATASVTVDRKSIGRGPESIKKSLKQQVTCTPRNCLDLSSMRQLGLLTLRAERAVSGECNPAAVSLLRAASAPEKRAPSAIRDSVSFDADGNLLKTGGGQAAADAAAVNSMIYPLREGSNDEELLQAFESLVIRLENCVASLELSRIRGANLLCCCAHSA